MPFAYQCRLPFSKSVGPVFPLCALMYFVAAYSFFIMGSQNVLIARDNVEFPFTDVLTRNHLPFIYKKKKRKHIPKSIQSSAVKALLRLM